MIQRIKKIFYRQLYLYKAKMQGIKMTAPDCKLQQVNCHVSNNSDNMLINIGTGSVISKCKFILLRKNLNIEIGKNCLIHDTFFG